MVERSLLVLSQPDLPDEYQHIGCDEPVTENREIPTLYVVIADREKHTHFFWTKPTQTDRPNTGLLLTLDDSNPCFST
jgi:hypothetical protein